MGAAVIAMAIKRALPRRVKNVRTASCAVGLAHARSSSTYLAHRSMTYASLPSQNASQGQLVTDPGRWDDTHQEPPQPVRDRRASLPTMASVHSSSSDTSGPTEYISRCLELQ